MVALAVIVGSDFRARNRFEMSLIT